jgi:hypothetical protein
VAPAWRGPGPTHAPLYPVGEGEMTALHRKAQKSARSVPFLGPATSSLLLSALVARVLRYYSSSWWCWSTAGSPTFPRSSLSLVPPSFSPKRLLLLRVLSSFCNLLDWIGRRGPGLCVAEAEKGAGAPPDLRTEEPPPRLAPASGAYCSSSPLSRACGFCFPVWRAGA